MHPKLPDLDDTIVALSSAVGSGLRAIVRVSGRKAIAIAMGICPEFDRSMIAAGRFLRLNLRLTSITAAVPAELYVFLGPRTYTGQDIVEIHIISSAPIVNALIADCLNAGARAAEPGEFTMRAFLAGKLDLTRVEAVLGIIEAGDRHELEQALAQLAGSVAQPLRLLREDLLNLLADVEAGLDFADEDIGFVATDELLLRIGHALAHLTNLRKQIDQRVHAQRPFRVVLAGKPNAGKSSLFNALVGKQSALVSSEPGTTRDYLAKTVEISGVKIELVDTAGRCDVEGEIEIAAQRAGREQVKHADLVLWCMACDEPEEFWAIVPGAVRIATKADRGKTPANVLTTSATTGAGLLELREFLIFCVRKMSHYPLAPSLSRCKHHIDACLQHLRNAHAVAIEPGTPEVLAMELRLTLDELGAMTGAVYTNDLLDRIFGRFCIGK